MKKKFILAFALMFATPLFAAKTTYIYTNHRFHYVKRVELDKKDLKKRGEASQPYTFTELQIYNMLAGVQISKKLILKQETEATEIFDTGALNFLTPHLSKAFEAAQPNEQIDFSVVSNKSKALFQENYLTMGTAWVRDNFLHVRFYKLMAKIDTTNYDKLGDVSKAINRAQGLRIALELKEGQQFGDSTDEILLPIPSAASVAAQPAPAPSPAAESKKSVKAEPASAVETRLNQLKELKDKNLITEEEYNQKRKEILKDL